MRTWASDSAVDDLKHDAIDELYNLNSEFKKLFQGVAKLLVSQYTGETPNDKLTNNPDFVGMLMDALFDIIFTQKYPMKYTKDPEYETPYETGFGQSSDIYDADIAPNPNINCKPPPAATNLSLATKSFVCAKFKEKRGKQKLVYIPTKIKNKIFL